MSSRSHTRLHLAALSVLSFAAAASARAQQLPPSRFVRGSSVAAAESAFVVARDSIAHYLHAASVQRRTGGSLMAAGLATIAAAYVQYSRSGRMGMTGSQAATFAAGTALGAVGVTRWAASRESTEMAARWQTASAGAR